MKRLVCFCVIVLIVSLSSGFTEDEFKQNNIQKITRDCLEKSGVQYAIINQLMDSGYTVHNDYLNIYLACMYLGIEATNN
ncbi:hypothetical protein FQA39_LY08029 [Lamprigera yunnana]|nr:hypothetical protein FQA39_LY08029 [Lamprigera yunnana]